MSGTSAFILENQQQKDLCSLFCVNLHLNIYIICLFCNKFSHEKEAAQIAEVNDMLENSHWRPQMRLPSLGSSGHQPFALEVSAEKLGADVSIISHM